MRRLALLAIALSSAAAIGFGGPAAAQGSTHVADGKLGDWRGTPTSIAGQTVTSRGEYIYTDWVYDDYGPDLNGQPDKPAFRANLSPTRGDYRYPDDPARYGYNAADLREVRVAADATTLHFLIALQTMKVANAAVVQIALDWDHLTKTSAKDGVWPDGSGITTFGPSHFITTSGNSAHVTGPAGNVHKVHSVANTTGNAIEVDVPLRWVGKAGNTPRIWAVAGLNDGKGRFLEQTNGETAVFNAAFRGFEPVPPPGPLPPRVLSSGWNDTRQSAVLASGDVTRFAGSFDLRRLRAGESDPRRPVKPGHYVRIFKSKKSYGEGIDLKDENSNVGGNPRPEFLSPYQPYALYVPKGYDPSHPNVFTLDGHSLDSSYMEFFTVSPNQQVELGDQRKSIIITPLARGADTWFIDSGLFDTIEAWNDARRHYAVDDERTFITGYSMGGYMTYRLGLLMPDRFAKASVYVGPPAYQLWPYPGPILPGDKYSAIGNTNAIVENAHNLPYEINHGNADELVPVAGVQHQADTFKADGNTFVFYRHLAADHLGFILNDEWAHTRDFLGTARRAKNPVEVIYRRFPAIDLPHDGLKFDRAYWVSQIVVRGNQTDPAITGLIDAVTHGFGGHRTTTVQDSTEAVTGPVSPGTKSGQHQVPGAAVPLGNAFDVTLDGVAGAAFALKRMGLEPHQTLKVHVDGDGVSILRLRGSFRTDAAVSGGATLTHVPGGVVLTVPSGTHDLTIAPG